MRFLWPSLFFLLALIPLALAAYVWALRRRRRFTLRYSSLALLRPAVPKYSRIRRHLPFALFLGGLGLLLLALLRPAAVVVIPTDQTTVILTLDVSGSMRSNDIQPTRLGAAEAAALDFIHRQKAGTHIGIVAFSGNAELVQPPTTDTEALTAAINSLYLGRATAIGSGILKSIDAIAEIDPMVPKSVADPSQSPTPVPVVPGTFAPDIIVLLTDGVSNAGIPPLDAAQQAVDRGVRVYTIGFGTQNGSIPIGPGGGGPPGQGSSPFGGGPFGGGQGGGFGGGGFGGRFRTGIDEATLKKIADMTGGQYYTASSADQLQKVFQGLPTNLIARHQVMEITVVFTAAGALLTLLAVALSLQWNPLP